MRRILWAFGWAGVAVWSLVSVLAYWFLDGIAALGMRHADMLASDPETVVRIASAFGALRGLSNSAVLVVWGIVSLLILSVPWLFDRAVAAAPRPSSPFVPSQSGRYAERQEGVIDLSPGEYTVSEPARGSVPTSGRRP